MLHVFMDTMIYLHYRPLAEMDFKATFDAEEITIQVARVTIQELDGHKNSHSSNRVRVRSRSILKFIEETVTGSKVVRPGVHMDACRINPTATLEEFELEGAWGDDRLVATVYDFAQLHPQDTVVLVTGDTGARLTCNHLGVTALELPEEYKLPAEQDEVEKENNKLRAQLQKYQAGLPKIKFGVGQTQEQFLRFSVDSTKIENLEWAVNDAVGEAMKSVPEINKVDLTPSVTKLSPLFQIAELGIPSDEEYTRYARERKSYQLEYESFVRAKLNRSARLALSFNFELTLANAGTRPAEDIDVWLHFPDGFVICKPEDVGDEVGEEEMEPSPPVEPRSIFESMKNFNQMPILRGSIFSDYYSGPVISEMDSATVKKTNSYEVERHFKRVKHGISERCVTLIVLFDSLENVKSFSADYRISVGNLPEPVEGAINFVFE